MPWRRDLVVFGVVLTVLFILAVTVLTPGFVPGCQDNAPTSPATAIEISYEDTTLRVTIAEGEPFFNQFLRGVVPAGGAERRRGHPTSKKWVYRTCF